MSPQEAKTIVLERSSSPPAGYRLQWHSIVKTVDTNKGKQNGLTSKKANKDSQKTILKEVSGRAEPGEIMAVMGPSGSGKTSLLNVLSGRAVYQSGSLAVNGVRLTNNKSGGQQKHSLLKRWMAKVAYVRQQDIFFDHLTVRDQLLYTSRLRRRPEEEVDAILQALRLQKVADSAIKAVSGGERKRVNIGTELLTNPSVLLLDEPTSGLDSTSAVALIRLLQSLAIEQGKTVITTIHQPSSALFRSFDRLLLLSEGSVVYFGTPVASLDYLEKQNLTCPAGYNAADHWMDLLVLQDDDVAATERRLRLEQAWEQPQDDVDELREAVGDELWDKSGGSTGKYVTSWWAQYTTLTHRALKNSRSAIFTPLNLIKSIALGLVAGLLWFQREYTESNLNDIQSYYFFTMTFWVFDAMFTSLTAFPSERDVILKERASQSYRLSTYFMAKTTADAPVRLILPLLYMIVSFWMAGISSSFEVFFGTIGCTLLSVLSGEAIGLFLGAAVYDLQKGLTIMTVFTLLLMLLGGFFVENVPVFIDWGKYLSPFKYAFDSSLQLVFNRELPCEDGGVLGDLCIDGFASPEDVLDYIGVQGSVGFNVGMLLVLSFIPRYFAYVALRMQKDSER